MGKQTTDKWKRLFHTYCKNWDPHDQQRYLNIPNDPEDIDEEELESCKELIQEISGTKPE